MGIASSPVDLALVGGGLQNGLIALAALAARPDLRLVVLERGPTLGGDHTWCFHADDVPTAAAAWFAPLVAHRWDGYEVAFPTRRRTLTSPYAALTSARFDAVVGAALAAAPNARLVRGAEVDAVAPGRVGYRADGAWHELTATTVVDARGPQRTAADAGWQKFVGHELALDRPHGLTRPMLMDATVPQDDGFRFFYVLPLAPDRLLIEDTRFSDGPELDRAALAQEIAAYAAAHGWSGRVVRTEHGCLPMPWTGDVVAPTPGLIVGGYQGGWFHPVTGYSLPIALRVAQAVADALAADREPAAALAPLVAEHRAQLGLAFRLTKMMFRWFAPPHRWGVLEHFYRLPEPTIRRFYALALTRGDRARLFVGRPPRGLSWRAVFGGAPAPLAKELT